MRVIVSASGDKSLSVIVIELEKKLLDMNGDARRSKMVTEITHVYFRFAPSQIKNHPAPANKIGTMIAKA